MFKASEREQAIKGTMFKEADYVSFMLGVFIVGALLAIPLLWSSGVGLGYLGRFRCPWRRVSCFLSPLGEMGPFLGSEPSLPLLP